MSGVEARVRVDPEGREVHLTLGWGGEGTPSSSSQPQPRPAPQKLDEKQSDVNAEQQGGEKTEESSSSSSSGGGSNVKGEFTAEEVAKHKSKSDVWVIIDGQVLDVTKFLPDHPGGEKAIMLYAGRDATEEFNMLHDPKVIPRYAPDAVIGSLKK